MIQERWAASLEEGEEGEQPQVGERSAFSALPGSPASASFQHLDQGGGDRQLGERWAGGRQSHLRESLCILFSLFLRLVGCDRGLGSLEYPPPRAVGVGRKTKESEAENSNGLMLCVF